MNLSSAQRRRETAAPQMLALISEFLGSSSALVPLRSAGYEIQVEAQDRGIQVRAQGRAEQLCCSVDAPLWWDPVEPAHALILSQRLALQLNTEWSSRHK